MWTIAIPLIKEFEGFIASPYYCSGHKLTIGYGEVIQSNKLYGSIYGNIIMDKADKIYDKYNGNIKNTNKALAKEFGDLISSENATDALIAIAQRKWRIISKSLTQGLTDNQCAAIISFVYNLGTGSFLASTLLKEIKANPNNKEKISRQWSRWIWAGGRKLKGLKIRRLKELDIYFS